MTPKQWKMYIDSRKPNQRWVLFSLETPLRSSKNTTVHWTQRYQTYHWTATYNANSDIHIPYGRYVTHVNNISKLPQNYFRTKQKLVAFMTSNCHDTKWPRLRFVHTLKKYVNVDIYGKCGTLKCNESEGCVDLLKQYKFHLTLENSQCEGYITEKFWNALELYESIPLAWGARTADYRKVAPPGSFVHVSWFKSIKTLAGFIKKVGGDQELYNVYHRWRSLGSVEVFSDWSKLPRDDQVCKAAELYHEDVFQVIQGKQPKFRDVNGRDWLAQCKMGKGKVQKKLPIPET
ncbi:Glycoprotein 3-alpha-L-fucosyltransferase A [Holothuria leucospilota]|uniref:Fucosyltransferase n=1 Tax=Holothuria leucospilota TaxID=206669 RepID=A0A9Q1HIM1_HOLLE|nr:Glycoprotein 3-alpha-L-fucosyltransferase A [Holothuria leucospilota]